MWVVEGSDKTGREQSKLTLSDPSPTYSTTMQQPGLPHPGNYLRLCPLPHTTQANTKNMAQMKEQIKAPEKIQLSDEEIANLSDTEFKTLVIRMLTELVEYGCKIEEKVKTMKSEIKENVQGTNSNGRKLGLKSTVWTRRKKETFNQNRMKKQEFKKMRGLGTSRTSSNVPISKA